MMDLLMVFYFMNRNQFLCPIEVADKHACTSQSSQKLDLLRNRMQICLFFVHPCR